jgi:hypothetical protein
MHRDGHLLEGTVFVATDEQDVETFLLCDQAGTCAGFS